MADRFLKQIVVTSTQTRLHSYGDTHSHSCGVYCLVGVFLVGGILLVFYFVGKSVTELRLSQEDNSREENWKIGRREREKDKGSKRMESWSIKEQSATINYPVHSVKLASL